MNVTRDVFLSPGRPKGKVYTFVGCSQTMTAGAIAANFNTATPTVSKHLQILTRCELPEKKIKTSGKFILPLMHKK